MGSWSVSCGISNIAITAGNKCVLVPLRKNNQDYGYFEYIPAMLPIFGEYNDYGGIEKIEKNINTELIEKVTGVTIEEFCEFLVDGRHTYNRSEVKDIELKIQHIEVMKNLRFMWMDRQVYDFMTTHKNSNGLTGSMGFPFVLRHFGFERVKDADKNEGRYTKAWERDGKKVYSDGQWIQSDKGKMIYSINAEYYTDGNLKFHFELTDEELSWHGKNLYHYYDDMNEEEVKKHLFPVISGRTTISTTKIDYEALIEKYKEEGNEIMLDAVIQVQKARNTSMDVFHSEYYENIMDFKKELSSIGILYSNLYCMSGTFRPYELYLTPQCGEFRDHQILLEKFAEINKSYIKDEDDDE